MCMLRVRLVGVVVWLCRLCLSCCFFVYTVGFGVFVWYNVAVSLE